MTRECVILFFLFFFAASFLISKPVFANPLAQNHHETKFLLRPRVAFVEEESNAKVASSLFRANLSSRWSTNFKTQVELDYVLLGWENHSSNGVFFNNTPVIPDTAGFDLNQLFFTYDLNNFVTFSAGRYALNLSTERFIGTNAFWQNEQTLDAASLKYGFGLASSFEHHYVFNVNRIFGEDAGKFLSTNDSIYDVNSGVRPPRFLGDHEHETHLFFAHIKEWDHSEYSFYLIDMNIIDASALSNNSVGNRLDFKLQQNELWYLAHIEIALQERDQVDENKWLSYINLGAGIGFLSSELSFQYEELGAKDGMAFITPLASLHDHNGWTDKFLETPFSGLRDYSLQYLWRIHPWKVDTHLHLFTSSDASKALGKEFNVELNYSFSSSSKLALRWAMFESQTDEISDEQRFFVTFTLRHK